MKYLIALLLVLIALLVYVYIQLYKYKRQNKGLQGIVKDYEELEKYNQAHKIHQVLIAKGKESLALLTFDGSDLKLERQDDIDVYINGIELKQEVEEKEND